MSSVRVGDIARGSRGRGFALPAISLGKPFAIVAAILVVLAVAWFALYNSGLFKIANVTVTGVSHITASEMTSLASVPVDSTLLNVDAGGIEQRLLQNPWVEGVSVNRILPDTLELSITERKVAAVVEVSTQNAESKEQWIIASDGIWIMNVPDQSSEEASSVSSQVYADADSALKITGVPYGVRPEAGAVCTDDSVLNALAIVDGMTTSLKDRVRAVDASGTDNTVLTLDDGVQIAFGGSGTTEEIREKERVCLQLLEENPGKISYINVRNPASPTWRSVS